MSRLFLLQHGLYLPSCTRQVMEPMLCPLICPYTVVLTSFLGLWDKDVFCYENFCAILGPPWFSQLSASAYINTCLFISDANNFSAELDLNRTCIWSLCVQHYGWMSPWVVHRYKNSPKPKVLCSKKQSLSRRHVLPSACYHGPNLFLILALDYGENSN